MAHGHRQTTLPHPPSATANQISIREQYATSTPSFRRPSEHIARSPPFSASLRRHPLSPITGSAAAAFTNPGRMDSSQFNQAGPPSIPPLLPITVLGTLQSADGTPLKIDIQGNIDKGFFLSEQEWTCYRRNYFSCVCSYTLTPYPTAFPLTFTQTSTGQAFTVTTLAMCISAVVSENDNHAIELVQHTPKRDKGPTAKPEKVPLLPKPPPAQVHHHPHLLHHGHAHHPHGHHHQVAMYNESFAGPTRGPFGDGFQANHAGGDAYQTEHTFERIQFKQATANNGKRRAAQQYYHLVVEVWADVGNQAPDNFVQVAFRKSAKMIVRGRSPGHYQTERRGSTSSGPGGSAGSMNSYTANGVPDLTAPTSGGVIGPGGFGSSFEPRSSGIHYGGRHHHHHHHHHHHQELPLEPMISTEDAKAIDTTREYQYYPGPIYEAQQDTRGGGVEMYTHPRSDADGGFDLGHDRIKRDPEGGILPSVFQPGPLMLSQRCGQFEGKSTSGGYYPTMIPPSGVNIADIS